MGEIFDRFDVEPQKGADTTIGTRFPEIFVSDRDEIICYLTMISCGFNLYKYHNKKMKLRSSAA